jgi:hypothetical protein
MRLSGILFLLALFFLNAGQHGTVKKITPEEAVSLAIRNNTSLKSYSQKKALVAEVENVLYTLVYQVNRYNILQKQAYLMRDLERVANLRFKEGDIDLLEKTGMISRFIEIKTAISMLSDDIAISGNKLKLLLLSKDDLLPVDSVLSMYTIQKGNDNSSGLDSSAQFVYEKKRENLEYALNSCFKKIQYFRQFALGKSDILLEVTTVRHEKEDIDYTEYTQGVDEAFQIQLDYLETLRNYNQIAIQLELYAY